MINTDETTGRADEVEVERIVGSGAAGAVVLAGIATATVIGLWFLFYVVVFSPRAAGF
ncbi:MAG: hypothetical protein M3N26_09900 [Pseudomonadota bacterium]|nr:hypothetical protein [Pseudomonadota bacterium]